MHIPGLEAPRRRLPLHPCQLPLRRRRRWRWRTILRPSSSARSAEPSPPARSEPPRRPGGLASAAKAGRLDPGPLRPRPCPLPRPLPRSLNILWPSAVPARRGLGGEGLVDSSGRPQSHLPARDPSSRPPAPAGLLLPAPYPLHRKCPSLASFPRWLAPRPL